jgi:multiple sugar transport system permease protein
MPWRILRSIGFFIGIALLGLFAIIPVLWALITIFKASGDLYVFGSNPFLFNEPPTLEHLRVLFQSTNFLTFLQNSVIVGVCVVVITLLLAVPAAYALARLTGGWGERSGMVIFLVYLIPPSLLFIPMYRIVVWLGLANTIWSLVVVLPTITIPFCTWLLLGFFRAVPRSLDEAALLDGCGHFGAFRKIILPQVWPGIGACMVFAFSLSLGNYIYAATFITASAQRTVTAGVPTELIRGDVFYWSELMAATLVVAIPLAIAYGLFFNYLVGGFKSAEESVAVR